MVAPDVRPLFLLDPCPSFRRHFVSHASQWTLRVLVLGIVIGVSPALHAWQPAHCAPSAVGLAATYRAPAIVPYATISRADTAQYAYGWFGVQPRQHLVRQFGYYRNYTQWRGQ